LTELRAAVVIGSGSASFEMLRHLVEVLPVMTTPRWVETRVQPIAVRDVLAYLTGVLGKAVAYGRVFEIPGFHFTDTTIIFQITGDEAQTVIRDTGELRGFVKWMPPYARSILRDEFGRESTISVSNPTKFGEATERAKSRLNETLGPHGIIVTQIVTPRPQFNDEYEKLIEERNKQGNQLEVIKSNLAAAQTSRKIQCLPRSQPRRIVMGLWAAPRPKSPPSSKDMDMPGGSCTGGRARSNGVATGAAAWAGGDAGARSCLCTSLRRPQAGQLAISR
jgi:hypothetical protein